jgi:hypothetical protein
VSIFFGAVLKNKEMSLKISVMTPAAMLAYSAGTTDIIAPATTSQFSTKKPTSRAHKLAQANAFPDFAATSDINMSPIFRSPLSVNSQDIDKLAR